jgi:hypothetical protein
MRRNKDHIVICLGHCLLRVAFVASALLLVVSSFAWIEAVRLPDYANYWEWRDGWHVGVRNAGSVISRFGGRRTCSWGIFRTGASYPPLGRTCS